MTVPSARCQRCHDMQISILPYTTPRSRDHFLGISSRLSVVLDSSCRYQVLQVTLYGKTAPISYGFTPEESQSHHYASFTSLSALDPLVSSTRHPSPRMAQDGYICSSPNRLLSLSRCEIPPPRYSYQCTRSRPCPLTQRRLPISGSQIRGRGMG